LKNNVCDDEPEDCRGEHIVKRIEFIHDVIL